MKTLVIIPGKKYYFFNKIDCDEIILHEEVFMSIKNKLLSLTQRISKKTGSWRVYSWFISSWKSDIESCEKCIIFDSAFSLALVKSIKYLSPKIKIYIYCWNPIFNNVRILREFKKVADIAKIYSFDKDDCNKYGFEFAPMVYDFSASVESEDQILYDVTFVGALKGRKKILTEVFNVLQEKNLKSNFYVLSSKHEIDLPFKTYMQYLDYEKYKDLIGKSKAVLDVVQPGQRGLTIRTLEVLCYHKKLISTNLDILNYDFYDPDNIFLIGYDDWKRLEEFLDTPFVNITPEVLGKYNFVEWVTNFNA